MLQWVMRMECWSVPPMVLPSVPLMAQQSVELLATLSDLHLEWQWVMSMVMRTEYWSVPLMAQQSVELLATLLDQPWVWMSVW